MVKKTIRDVDFSGKRVLVRVDFNVPLTAGDGNFDEMSITDDTRIRAAIPTIQYILDQKPKAVILMTHLGRPDGRVVPQYSVKPIVPVLSQLLGQDVMLVGDILGYLPKKMIGEAPDGAVILLQNTRYYPGEEKNDPAMAGELASYGDIFVNDAFGTAHRAHASNVGIAEHLEAVAGFLMEKEVEFLATAMENPASPFIAILGGAKVSDKVKVIEALLGKVDRLLIGGGMAVTFLKAKDYATGRSRIDEDAMTIAKGLVTEYGSKILLPVDVVASTRFANDGEQITVDAADGVPETHLIMDIGPKTVEAFKEVLEGAKTVVWNGPVGVFEFDNFATGTMEIARALGDVTAQGGTTIIGGGDSAAAIAKAGLTDKMTHVSTGGGASLEMLEGRELPGVAVLADK